MNGGKLIQDVSNHALWGTHPISNVIQGGDDIYEITSTHHQMQYPFNLDTKDYDLLFTSYRHQSYEYHGDGIDPDEVVDKEPEIVMYHKEGKPKCLAVQGHPEMIPDSPVAKMISELIIKLVNEIK
jgi:hypothetical protein